MPFITVWIYGNALPARGLEDLRGTPGIKVLEALSEESPLEEILSGQAPDVCILKAGGEFDPRLTCLCSKDGKVKVILTGRCGRDAVREYLKSGIKGYIDADAPGSLVLKAIRVVHAGEIWADRDTISDIFNEIANARPEREPADIFERLSAREKEVFGLVAGGGNNREIAESLFICEKTVKAHCSSIFRKLGVRNRLQAVLLMREKGFRPAASSQIPGE